MKKLITTGIVLILAAITLPLALARKAVDVPSGVAADQWFPINDHMGMVISEYQPGIDPMFELPRPSATPSAAPAMNGYLMIKQNGRWVRVFIVSPPK